MRYTPSAIQTLNSVVALALAYEAGVLSPKKEWTTALNQVCDIISNGIYQRIAKQPINVRHFDSNTTICGECYRCNTMPYDYLGILHYLDAIPTRRQAQWYHVPATDALCAYYERIQRQSGAWGALDVDEYPDDVLATACILLVMHHHDPARYRHCMENGGAFLLRQLDQTGRWKRSNMSGLPGRPSCAESFDVLVQHKCIEALCAANYAEVYQRLFPRVGELYTQIGVTQTAPGFVNRTEVDGTSEVSGACHWLQALLKLGVLPGEPIMKELVATILRRQQPNGGFIYTEIPGRIETTDVSDITAFAIQTLSLYTIRSLRIQDDD